MTPQQILELLIIALKGAGFVVYENDDHVTPSAFPGDAIAYIFHDQVELYLVNGGRTAENGQMAADRAATAIHAAGLQAEPGVAGTLVNGRVIVTSA
ncbi:hypothetical protein AB0392_07075 [Nonomuraea angiospora]|uniref:hypothetical protein n=1 Tax=Nonomuraea angiospora TaxID=46172 RepID=UPI00344C2B98